MPLAGQLVHQRYVHPGPLVLRTAPFKSLTPATDRDRTVSRRSEPSSRATLIGEQPNPWDRIQPQDVTSRHRGAKPPRRCGRLGEISLLSTTIIESIEVVCKEFMLLEYLMKNKNQVFQKEQLYEKIWGLDNESESNNLEAYLSFIRKKIKIIGSNVQIKAIRGLVYKLEVEN